MEKYGVEVEDKKPKAKEVGLQELPGTHENIVLRFAPNPSGPLHIGHSRAAVPNAEYVKRHNGKLILRIEDTDQKREVENGTEGIINDLSDYQIKIDEGAKIGGEYGPYIQTKRKEIYETLGFTVNIGIANNKLCAKMASDFEKPNKVHTLFLDEIEKIKARCENVNRDYKNLEEYLGD